MHRPANASQHTSDRWLLGGLLFLSASLATSYWLLNPDRQQSGDSAVFDALARQVDLNEEANVAAWFSSLLWIIATSTAINLYRAALNAEQSDRAERLIPDSIYWLSLSFLFLLMSLSEVAMVHESVGNLVAPDFSLGIPLYTSSIIALIFTLAVGALLLGFMLRLPRTIFAGLMLSGAVYLAGGFGFESIGAFFDYRRVDDMPFGMDWRLLILLEELLEMIGVIILIATLRYHYRATESNRPLAEDRC